MKTTMCGTYRCFLYYTINHMYILLIVNKYHEKTCIQSRLVGASSEI